MTAMRTARKLLFPLIPLYRMGLAWRGLRLRRAWEPVERLRLPVVSVGNLSTGGTGKTPFTIALARALGRRGVAVDVLSRGYGRRTEGPARVRADGTADEFGDEPILIAGEAGVPVYVARRRFEAGTLAEGRPEQSRDAGRAEVHLLDDGFQHRQLFRDVDIVLVNRDDWQDWLLPAGNLREPRKAVLRASVIAIAAEETGLEELLRGGGWKGPVWKLQRRVEVPKVDGPVVAFCGIARPGQFFEGLEAAGMRLTSRIVFRDHHRYVPADLIKLRDIARTAGAGALVTTKKDEVRLRGSAPGGEWDLSVLTAGLRIEIEDEDAAMEWLIGRLRGSPGRGSL